MSLDKAIASGKEHRKPMNGNRSANPSCRNNTCFFCLSNDTYRNVKREQSAKDMEKDDGYSISH